MFGATSSSRPPVPKTSYWPSTLEDRNARMPPAWTPVAREPMAVASGPGRASCFSARASTSGFSRAAMPAALASIQPGRSTTATSGTGPPSAGLSPVSPSTCATARAAASCSSRTTPSASSRVVSGPGPTSLRAVRPARSQSTIEDGLLIASKYARNLGRGGSAAAALRQGGRDVVERALRGVDAGPRGIGEDGEGEQPAVLGDHRAGQAADPLQGAGLGADGAGCGSGVVVAAVEERAVVAGHRQP